MTKKTSYIVAGIAIIAAVGSGVYYRNAHTATYMLATVTRGDITSQVLASGNVQSPTTTNLHFQAAGKLVALNVQVNQRVAAGATLARQDTSVLQAQLVQAQAAVDGARATLRKLEMGATPQSIAVSNAALISAQQSLQNSYAAVPNTIADAYAKANDAVTSQLATLFSNAQTANPQLAFTISDSQVVANAIAQRLVAGSELAVWQQEIASKTAVLPSQLDEELALADAHLAPIQSLLTTAVTAVADSVNLPVASANAYRASVSAGLSETNAAIAEIRTIEQSIASQKAAIAQSQAQLGVTTASSTENDIAVAQASVEQAQANVGVIQAQIRNLEIIAPASGIVTATNGTEGEVITPDVTVVSLMPLSTLQVKVNVSEDNIVKVQVGEPVKIELDAFPSGTEFAGVVSEIDPAQTVIGGAIYYHTTLLFGQNYPNIKPGMTANVWIDTGTASSTLIIPVSALLQTGSTPTVQVYNGGNVSVRPVAIGLKDQKGMVEITSGLAEGEQVVTASN